MTTLLLRAAGLPNGHAVWPVFARIATTAFAAVADVIAEAGHQADAAHRRLSPR